VPATTAFRGKFCEHFMHASRVYVNKLRNGIQELKTEIQKFIVGMQPDDREGTTKHFNDGVPQYRTFLGCHWSTGFFRT